MVTKVKLFQTNQSQALRLPKEVAFPDDVQQVEIIRSGDSRIITPVGKRWADYFANGPFVSEDFLNDRDQPPFEDREPF